MEEDPAQREITEKMLEAIRREYGFVPVVNQVLSARPDVFVPMGNLSKAVLEADGDIDRKHRYLCAISAASALGGEYCLDVQTKHAIAAGATKDEIFEAMTIGAYMAMTRSESYAFRKLASNFGMELERAVLISINNSVRNRVAMVSISADAEKFINDLLEKNQKVGYGIKIYLSGYACSGPQFGMSFQQAAADGETVDTSAHGFEMYYDDDTRKELEECVIEFIDDPNFGTGLTIRNPNFDGCSSCGGGCH